MGVWERSWYLARTSFGVIRQDKEMLWFPILSGLFSILFSVALFVPTFLVDLNAEVLHTHSFSPLQTAVLFVDYFGLSFIVTFFNVCVVYTTRARLSGGDATFLDSIRFAISRVHLIAAWSLVSATVGLLLRALERLAERLGAVGNILISLLRFAIASAWSITSLFVVPAMVYRDLGPLDALRDSIDTLKRHWGESLIRHFGLGFAAFVCALPALLLLFGGFMALATFPPLGIALIALGLLAFLGVVIVFNVANTVYNTALYHWATQGVIASGFDASLLAGAFTPKG
jgi:Family of unknown function (DUF6159)